MKILHLIEKGNCNVFLRKNKDKSLFDDNTYKKIYPSRSKSATVYGLMKNQKLHSNYFQDRSFHHIVSSIATYNYNLARFLSEILLYQSSAMLKTHSLLCE